MPSERPEDPRQDERRRANPRPDDKGRLKPQPASPSVDAVIWDLDGVILDSELQHIEAEIDTFGLFSIALTRELAMHYMGVRMEEYFNVVADWAGTDVPVSDMLEAHHETLRWYYGEVFGLSPHARTVLSETSRICRQALATNREEELALLSIRRFGLEDFFDVTLFGDSVKRGKPDPEIYLATALRLEVEPGRCLVVEDSVTGLRAARGAGMRVAVRRAKHNAQVDFDGADYLVEDLRDIPGILYAAQHTHHIRE